MLFRVSEANIATVDQEEQIMRGAVTRRSLDANAPERKSGRAAFKSARSLFEAPGGAPTERGDEQYGNAVYTAAGDPIEEEYDPDRTDESSNSKSIHDLIKVSNGHFMPY